MAEYDGVAPAPLDPVEEPAGGFDLEVGSLEPVLSGISCAGGGDCEVVREVPRLTRSAP